MTVEPNFSSIYYSWLALVSGLTLLVAGGETLVSGAVKLAARLGMTSLLIGLTVVAFGTSMPEFFVSLSASLMGQPDIMLGNVIGSNIANVGLILGFCALLVPLAAPFKTYVNELYLVVAASIAVAAIAWYEFFARPLGLVFIGTLILFTYFSYKKSAASSAQQEDEEDGEPPKSLLLILPLCAVGLVGLSLGSNLFIEGAIDVARYFGVSSLVIGLTLAAVGTSLPELASSISAIRRNETNLLMGNIIGSNLFNLLMVLGGTALIKPFTLQKELLFRDLPVMFLFSAILIPLLKRCHKINRLHGFFLLAGYLAYMLILKIG